MNTDELEAAIESLITEEDIDAVCAAFAKTATKRGHHVVNVKRIKREGGIVWYHEDGSVHPLGEANESLQPKQ